MSDGSVFDCNMNLGAFEEVRGLIHCHRSYLVNLRYVRGISRTALVMDDGRELPLSRRLYDEVNRRFIEFYTST